MESDIVLLILFILLYGIFKMIEAAFNGINLKKLRLSAEDGNEKSEYLIKYFKKIKIFEASIQLGYILCFMISSYYASEILFGGFSRSNNESITVYQILYATIFALIILLFGNLVTKSIGTKYSDAIVSAAKKPIFALSIILMPFILPCVFISSIINELLGVSNEGDEAYVTEEEIRILVDVSEDAGAIDENEKEMINNIFEFNNTMVGEIATHRTDIVAVPIKSSLQDIIEVISEEKFSRIPVYNENIDDIIGFFRVRDLLNFYVNGTNGSEFNFQDIILEPYYVPFSKKIDELFEDMQKNKVHMAIVIDEYGGTAGIVTMEDLIEEIVGNILDEYDIDEEEIRKVDDYMWLVKGTTEIDEVEEELEIEIKDAEEYDTIGGFIIGQLGRIPEENESPEIEVNNLIFKVEKIDDKRIELIRIIKIKQEEPIIET